MARKKLNDLAKIGLGLAAAYGASKVLGKSAEQKGLDIARSETRDLTSDESIAPRRTVDEAQAEGLRITRAKPFEMSDDATAAKRANYNPKTGLYGEPGSLEGFRASEEARRERIGTPYALDPKSPKAARLARLKGAKTGKMIKASTGGSVVARGNKLARSKPTKLF
jgi:hypothetical protein